MNLDRFTRKLGPLPIYAWALIIVGAAYAFYRYSNRNSAGSAASAAPVDASGTATDSGYASAGLPAGGSAGSYTPDSGTSATDSSSIGLASSGTNVDPFHVVIDSPTPSLYTPPPAPPAPVSHTVPAAHPATATTTAPSTSGGLSAHQLTVLFHPDRFTKAQFNSVFSTLSAHQQHVYNTRDVSQYKAAGLA